MPFSLKTKQVASVTLIVGLSAVLLSAWFLSELARVRLEESHARVELLAKIIYQRVFDAVQASGDADAVRDDRGVLAALDAALLAESVLYAAIVDTDRTVVAHYDPEAIGTRLPDAPAFSTLLDSGRLAQIEAIYNSENLNYEFQGEPMFVGDREVGTICIGVSILLIRQDINDALETPILTAVAALVLATLVAMVLAQVVLRPIHVIRSGLARLGRGELDVQMNLPQDESLGDLGDSFRAISARLAADRSELAGHRATLESVVEHLEDAVALVAPDGTLLFANAAMTAALGPEGESLADRLPPEHPYRTAVEAALADPAAAGQRAVDVAGAGERLVITDRIEDADHRALGVLLVVRNLAYLSEVRSTLSYSQKLAALSRLSAGIAHEIKNPLNATMIHLELLKMKITDRPEALEHVSTITSQVRRLDEVVQGLLKFTRPEDVRLQPVAVRPLFDSVMPIVRAEAAKNRIDVVVDCPSDVPAIWGDRGMLEQALLNLALNACQAMPDGGRLRLSAAVGKDRRVEISVEDSGVGISPEHLERIFDLYFTTKPKGSGIGLSLVYRAVQLHDGEIEVQSSPGHGTTFRIRLPRAANAGTILALPAS